MIAHTILLSVRPALDEFLWLHEAAALAQVARGFSQLRRADHATDYIRANAKTTRCLCLGPEPNERYISSSILNEFEQLRRVDSHWHAARQFGILLETLVAHEPAYLVETNARRLVVKSGECHTIRSEECWILHMDAPNSRTNYVSIRCPKLFECRIMVPRNHGIYMEHTRPRHIDICNGRLINMDMSQARTIRLKNCMADQRLEPLFLRHTQFINLEHLRELEIENVDVFRHSFMRHVPRSLRRLKIVSNRALNSDDFAGMMIEELILEDCSVDHLIFQLLDVLPRRLTLRECPNIHMCQLPRNWQYEYLELRGMAGRDVDLHGVWAEKMRINDCADISPGFQMDAVDFKIYTTEDADDVQTNLLAALNAAALESPVIADLAH